MRFIIFILFVLAVIFIVWRISRGGKIEIVAHARLLFKTWSVWLASAGSAVGAWVQSFPDSASNAWEGLPEDVKSFIPQHFLGLGAAFMVAMAVIAQFIRQKKLVKELPAVIAAAPIAAPKAVTTSAPITAPAAAPKAVPTGSSTPPPEGSTPPPAAEPPQPPTTGDKS